MEILGMWLLIAGSMAVAWWLIYHTNNDHYETGYWAGRNDGWRASLEHQERVRKMRSEQVFDYDKN
ncbi:hypothetical protein UFOVP441_25 [uncultured Caudovirales phage]|uniref:Uncharacterized protein n=1 Tax=uncultured Caudovirales phage TaxID=2100421 RepID=A0A6J5M7R0_9CAUD|nr:hypothetical protein UFOVP441_25 [uncultured Caudovirales phage]